MSLASQFIENYVGNPQYMEILRAMLGLTQYEGASFIALAFSGESSATRIADTAGIPRSKIYSTLNSLIKKELILKVRDQYKVNVNQIQELPRRGKDIAEGFQKFLEKLSIYSRTSATKVQAIKSLLEGAIQTSGFHDIPFDRDVTHDEKFQMYFERALMDFRYSHAISFGRARDMMGIPSYFIDELLESSTSGIKVAINILTEEKYQTNKDLTIFGTLAMGTAFRCEAVIFILLPEVSLMEKERVDQDNHNQRSPTSYFLQAHDSALDKNVFRILSELDRSWSSSKREVDKIGNAIKDLKIQLTSTLDSTYQHARDVTEKGGKHKERYLEILERIQADLIASEDLLANLRLNFEHVSEKLERIGKLPEPSEIIEISKRVEDLREDLQRKIQARDQLLEDILAHMRGGRAYIEYGYVTNPFVFTVPPEYPRDIVNQNEARGRIDAFLTDMIKGSSRNFVFVCADEGMGKTHFLNFHAKIINDKKYGNSVALRLNCKPKSDIIDLYTQVSLSISRLTESKILKAEIIKTLEIAGTPKNINDLISLLRSLNSSIMESGFQGMFLLIDDFENTLPADSGTLSPRSILQLTELAKLENIGIIVAMREKSWEIWNKEIRNRLPRVGRISVIKLGKLGSKETCDLLEYRVSEKDTETRKEPPHFDLCVSEKICEKGNGVPRQIISIAREVFRIAILENKKITTDLVESVTAQDSINNLLDTHKKLKAT
jgi:DNA-binding MarR family transcriptional regulator